MHKTFSLLLTAFSLSINTLFAQSPTPPAHTVYLLGNTATTALSPNRLRALRQTLEKTPGTFTVVHLGDVVGNNGLGNKKDSTRAGETERIDALLGLVKGLSKGRIYFVPGDKDWDNSGPDGLKRVRRLEKYIEKQLGGQDAFLPSNGCPGPDIIDVAPNVRLIAISTPWWTHPYHKPEAPSTDCKTLTQDEFREELQDALEETNGRNVLVVGHQPVISKGVYGGHMPFSRHLLPPVLGSFYAAYRQNVGLPRDMANPAYQEFTKQMLSTLQENPGVIYAAAHDYSLQLNRFQGSYHLVSGSVAEKQHVGASGQALFNQSAEGFSKLEYYADGTVKAYFETFDKRENVTEAYAATVFQSACQEPRLPGIPVNAYLPECPTAPQGVADPKPDAPAQATVTVAPGPQYAAGPTRRFWIGPLYRTSWTQPVQVKTLNLATEKGGLRPFGRGGGRQTTSLKLIAADSAEYVFRSVDKDVTRILPPELRISVAADILRDITPTAHPYSALVISSMLDKTDILHARPRLFVLPDNKQLGPYRDDYAGLLGTLEDRPKDPKPNLPGFGNADNIRRSGSFIRQLYKDNDNRVDAYAYGKARAFDMLVADFGKHEDNWKWAGYDKGKRTVYKPIPRDRDQAFTQWNGVLTYLANRDWAVPSIEDFQAKFHDMKSLNWPARHLDRFLAQSLSREDWHQIGRELQQTITPAVIDEATATLPPELENISTKDLNRKLKARIQELPKALDKYYLLLAEQVDVVGSNKGEVFLADRLPDGNLRVRMYDKASGSDEPTGPILFDRTFKRNETREVSLYGLGGKDVFRVTGQARKGILLRVIGGEDQDKITDDSRVAGLRTLTKIYDTPNTDLTLGPESDNRTSTRPDVNQYDREAFEYDAYQPSATLGYNRNDGFIVGAGVSFLHKGFRKPDFRNLYAMNVRASSNGNFQVGLESRYRHAIGKWDIGARAEYGNSFPYYNFFGLGNNATKDEELYDARYYRARYKGYTVTGYLERTFFNKRSVVRVGPSYEQYSADFASNSYLGELLASDTPQDDARTPNTSFQRLAGLSAIVDLDLRDRQMFARRGVRLRAQHDSYQQLNRTKGTFGLTQGFAEYYGTARLFVPATLVVKLGGAKNYGDRDEIPFYKYTSLGLREGLRGYYRNRFTGDASAYLNTELRLALGNVQTSFLPFSYGVFGFFDRGRVYYRGASPDGWHDGYGAGFYVAPVTDQLALSISYQHSREQSGMLQFGVGFRIDQ